MANLEMLGMTDLNTPKVDDPRTDPRNWDRSGYVKSTDPVKDSVQANLSMVTDKPAFRLGQVGLWVIITGITWTLTKNKVARYGTLTLTTLATIRYAALSNRGVR